MFKRPYYIALALVGLLILLVLNLPNSTTARIKASLGSVFLPLFGVSGTVQQTTARAAGNLLPKSELIAENNSLRRQNQELRLLVVEAEAITRENDRLRQLIGWQKQNRWRATPARVIYRDPSNWWRTIQIDRGSLNGLSNNLAVLSPDGFLIGRISSVSLTRSQVVLIGDDNCKVPAIVENETRSQGIVTGGGPFDDSFAHLTHLPNNAKLKPGQRVVTSDLSRIYPAGIQIGQIVEESRPAQSGLIQEAEVKLSANLSSLEEVWVLFR